MNRIIYVSSPHMAVGIYKFSNVAWPRYEFSKILMFYAVPRSIETDPYTGRRNAAI